MFNMLYLQYRHRYMVIRKVQRPCNKYEKRKVRKPYNKYGKRHWGPDVSSTAGENAIFFQEFIPHAQTEEIPLFLYVSTTTRFHKNIIFMCDSIYFEPL